MYCNLMDLPGTFCFRSMIILVTVLQDGQVKTARSITMNVPPSLVEMGAPVGTS